MASDSRTRIDGVVEPHDTRGDLKLDCDVVVVGSGAGGAAAAATLAEAGHDVLVLEEGGNFGTRDYGADIPSMFTRLMRAGGGTALMGRSPIGYLEGRCIGGTTVVNGGMCWRTPERVLNTWVRERGLSDLAPRALEPIFEEVERTINARHQDPGSEGDNNNVFKRGADRLGWRLSRNKRAQVHCVGSNDCVTGCPSGAKMSSALSWLPRLYARGGKVYTQLRVRRILTEHGRAVGVAGDLVDVAERRRFTVRAKAVLLACGAIQTPLLLQRNKLARGCGHVGRHFTVHPNIKMAALFDDEISSLRGTHQAWQCTEFEHEGILLAPGLIPVGMLPVAHPAFGRRLAAWMRDHRHVATGGLLVDDHGEGRIRLLPFGLPLIRYDVTDADQACFHKGAAYMAELYFAAGAKKVFTPFHSLPVIHSPDDIRRIYDERPRVEDTEYFTAHLMGTCRMDSRPKQGVVGPDGQTFDVPGLYIADASVMPGTIGVNPQVTIMALARLVAQKLADRLAGRRAA